MDSLFETYTASILVLQPTNIYTYPSHTLLHSPPIVLQILICFKVPRHTIDSKTENRLQSGLRWRLAAEIWTYRPALGGTTDLHAETS